MRADTPLANFKNGALRGAQRDKMADEMQIFRQGIEAGYALAVEELRAAIETGAIRRRCGEALELLETWSLDAADRWTEESAEQEQG